MLLHMHIMLLQMFRRALILSRPVVPSLSVFVIAAQSMWHMSCSGCLTVSAAKSLSFLLSIFSFFFYCVLSWTTQHCFLSCLSFVTVFCLGQHSTAWQSLNLAVQSDKSSLLQMCCCASMSLCSALGNTALLCSPFAFGSPSIGLYMSAANVPCATQHCDAVLAFWQS
jgi:hypothetical protein